MSEVEYTPEIAADALAATIAAGASYAKVIIQDPRDADFGGRVPWIGDTYADASGNVVKSITFVNVRAARQWLDMAKAHGVYVAPKLDGD